jgi:uncharacterized protein
MTNHSTPLRISRAIALVLMLPVRAYRLFLSPWLGSACRFNPTCSAYALQALDLHGPAAGSYLAARRILRCHPGCEGGHDPVPAAEKHATLDTFTPKKST